MWEYFQGENGIVLGQLNGDGDLKTRHFNYWYEQEEKSPLQHLDEGVFTPPSDIRETEPELVEEEIMDFVQDYLVVQDPHHATVISAWILHTWLKDAFTTYPYLYFLGDKGTGKTRALEILSELAHRPLFSVNVSEASLYRMIDLYDVSYLIDEIRYWRDSDKRQALADLQAGYKKGQVAVRMDEASGQGFKPSTFETWGPKAFASTDAPTDQLADRCVIINMEQASPPKKDMDAERAEEIRQGLAYLRLNHFAHDAWNGKFQERSVDADNDRLNEILDPLKTVLTIPENQEDIDVVADRIVQERKEALRTSDEADWLMRLRDQYEENLAYGGDKIYYTDLARENESGQGVANTLRYRVDRWNLRKDRNREGTYIPLEENLPRLKQLWEKYGINYTEE